MSLLKISDLHARIEGEDGREILKGINLEINPGEEQPFSFTPIMLRENRRWPKP